MKYPDVKVQLTDKDGNSFAILARCRKAARNAKVPQSEIDVFMKEAMGGDYAHLLMTCMEWFDCE